jgi:curved DNA-binding protein CbpA
MLGVSRRAGRGQIRAAFFALAKEFHPDAYYGREIGDYLGRLERIFRTASRAFEVLSRPASRERYDEYLRGQSILAGKEEEERAWAEAERRASSPEETPAGPAEPAAAGAAEPAGAGAMTFEIPAIVVEERPWTEEGGEARAESLSSAGERGIQEGPPGGAASEPPPGARTSDAWHRERAVRRLTAALGAIRRERGPERRGTEYLRAAAEAAQTEEWGKVFGLLEAAEKLGLSDPEKAQHGELLCRAGRELGRICVSQASFAEQTGDLGTAIKHAESACRYEPDNPVQWDLLARLLLRQGRKLQRARDAAHRAIQLAPRTVEYRVTMVRVYLAAGLVKNARREAEAATKLAPDHPEARALLAEARKAKE